MCQSNGFQWLSRCFVPRPRLQLWVVMASFVASTFMFPILISIITTSLISRDTIREEFNRKLEVWNQYMAHRRLPLKLRNRIRSFMTYRWRTHRGVKEDTMLADLPSSLAVEVRLITCQSLIREVPIFRDAPPGFISSLVPHLRLELFLEGEWIIRESTSGREMFFIHSVRPPRPPSPHPLYPMLCPPPTPHPLCPLTSSFSLGRVRRKYQSKINIGETTKLKIIFSGVDLFDALIVWVPINQINDYASLDHALNQGLIHQCIRHLALIH